DANLIVSLLDIHITPSTSSSLDELPLEILEAGTGHGALTLHLARAIHAANVSSVHTGKAQLPEPSAEQRGAVESGNGVESITTTIKQPGQQRRAVIHTLDIAEKHSDHAKQVVAGFKHGIYAGNVEFYVGDVGDWVSDQLRERKRPSAASESPEMDAAEADQPAPFLSHVFLDMPKANMQIESIAPALRADGVLMIFNPSITQIAECVEDIKRLKLPFAMEQVVEMGSGSGVGGREWDVRAVRPRILTRKENTERDAKLEQQDQKSKAEVNSASTIACEEEAKEGMKSRDQEQAESLKEQVRSKPEEEQGWTLLQIHNREDDSKDNQEAKHALRSIVDSLPSPVVTEVPSHHRESAGKAPLLSCFLSSSPRFCVFHGSPAFRLLLTHLSRPYSAKLTQLPRSQTILCSPRAWASLSPAQRELLLQHLRSSSASTPTSSARPPDGPAAPISFPNSTTTTTTTAPTVTPTTATDTSFSTVSTPATPQSMPAPPHLTALLHTPPFAADIRHFRDDLAAGRLLPAWRVEAERAGRMRAEGVFEAWRTGEMERVWGVGVRGGGARRAGEEEWKKDKKDDEKGQLDVGARARGTEGRIVGDGEASRDKKNGENGAARGAGEGLEKQESTGEVKFEEETAE
ncbi:hypothetical protein LTR60_003552, partial [Cryomyces antarcticus]